MKKEELKRLIVAILLCAHGYSQGYYYDLRVMKKIINKQTNQQQLVFGLGDYHDKTHPANKAQRGYLESLLKKCVGSNSKVIVEDLSSVNNDGRMVCCNYGVNCSDGVLGQIAHQARSLGVAVDNVEYRYCRVASIGPLLSNLRANPESFRSSATITTASLYKEIVDEIAKIRKYDDGKLLNSLYKRTTNTVCDALRKIEFNQEKPSTVAHFCKQLQSDHYRHNLEKLCIFDSALIDMNIMHSIVNSPEVSLFFVFAGGSHIEQVSELLKRLGYETVFATSQKSSHEIKKVLNSDSIYTPADTNPIPIDMSMVETFLR